MSINYHTHTLPLVGHLSVLQTGEAKLPREVLTRAFIDSPELDVNWLSPAPRPGNSFLRATSAVSNTKMGSDVLIMRPVVSHGERLVRHLVQEVNDGAELSYRTVLRFELTGGKFVSTLDSALQDWQVGFLTDLAYQVKETFEEDQNYYPKRAVTTLLENVMKRARSSNVSRTVEFIPHRNEAVIRALHDALRATYQASDRPEALIAEMIPLIDTEDQRMTVVRALQGDAARALNRLANEMKQAKAVGASDRQIVALRQRARAELDKVDEYRGFVSGSLDTIAHVEDDLRAAFLELIYGV